MVAGSIFGLGVTNVVYTAAVMILGIMRIDLDIGGLMPDGILSMLSLYTVEELCVKAIAVSVVFIAVFLATNYFVLRKRDVR